MADHDTPDTQTAHARSCGMSLQEHAELIMSALTMFGLGIGCETEYQALLCIAECAKILHGHAEYDPTPQAQAWADDAKKLRAALALEEAETDARDGVDPPLIFPAPDNGKVH